MKMTVYFDGAFWSALIEFRDSRKRYKAFTYVFGKEPTDADVWRFVHEDLEKWLSRYDGLAISNQADVALPIVQKKTNPKRMQRELSKAKKQPVVSTKAQQAMQELQESLKDERKRLRKQAKEARKQERYQLRQEKRHQKKRGH